MLGKRDAAEPPPADPEVTAQALAKAVCEGDIVNFRLLFSPFSPARDSSIEQFDMPKYAYLLPDETQQEDPRFKDTLTQVKDVLTMGHIRKELEANRPAQLPSNLVLALADNAVRDGKFTSAAQAYELLRIRERMQQAFFEQADAALDQKDVPRAVQGYLIATGLEYDYAAFPEPLPATPDFQTHALVMHADYPERPEDCIGMWDAEALVRAALTYLLLGAETAARLDGRPLEVRLAFLGELVRRHDPAWDVFVERLQTASALAESFGDRVKQAPREFDLAEEIAAQQGDDPLRIPSALLGREIERGEWWQYLKELASEHPAAALFVARQAVGDTEILAPRYRPDSPVAQALGVDAAGVSGS